MSFIKNPAFVPDRDSLPLKKRDQRPSPPPPSPPNQQQHQQQCDAATFKAPFPYRNHSDFKDKHTSPFQPVPRRVPPLYQPWMQTHTSTRSKPHILSAFREHHGWAEWRDFNPLQPRWDFTHPYQQHNHLSPAPALHPVHPHHHISRFNLVNDGFQRVAGGYGWEQLKAIRDKNVNTERQSNGRNKEPYLRRRDRKVAFIPRVEKVNSPLLRTPQSPSRDFSTQHGVLHKSTKVVKHPGHSLIGASPDNNSRITFTSMKEDASRSSDQGSSPSSSSSSSSCNQFPWLLPHFVAGSLIELRDGRLRRVEHLQTEDFLLGSLACPDLCLSCCTVQCISPSSSSSSISRLLILLHSQQSQELVDVYVEYPFFVRGRGWSSCSPQRTTRLCGLQCRQLSVGDVCLALTPVSAPQSPPSATLVPKNSPRKSEGRCESLKAPQAQVPPEPGRPSGGQRKEAEAVRRRHYSAPELGGLRTNCL
ncbi:uncharacterized protein LKV04_002504 isoform 1-T2 [Tautogolabrus adspersus]